MRVTYRGDYALKAVLDLALHYEKSLVTSHDMAQRINAPTKFLEQVLLELKKGGFVESRRGNVGGYLLSKEPSKITVGEVIRYIDGPVEPIACVNEKYLNCNDEYKCVFRRIWQDVSFAISNIVDNVNFRELAAQMSAKEHVYNYSI